MSKSHDNTIPLFAEAPELRKLIFSLVTDSRAPGQPKDTEGSSRLQVYQAFASQKETQAMGTAFAAGISWSDAKDALFERIEAAVAPMRGRYQELVADAARLEQRLQEGPRPRRPFSRRTSSRDRRPQPRAPDREPCDNQAEGVNLVTYTVRREP
jgi:tryptophanyl-tRNA synthetase